MMATNMTPMTIPDLLSLRACEQPNAIAYSYLDNGEDEAARISYADLEQRSLAVAELLCAYAKPGDRVVLIYPPGLEFLDAFFGCLFARIVAVPLHSPRPGRHNDRLAAIITNADAKLVLTTRDLLPKVQQTMRDQTDAPLLEILTTDDLDLREHREPHSETILEEHLAFLQYTSGSTSAPKGVMVSHGNLLANQRMIHQTFQGTKDSIVLGWLPLYHDMGLIGNVLQTLWMGSRCILMSPASFLQRPAHWLESISRYRATISGGPDFAYRLCTEKITGELSSTLDLSCWTVAFNGSEPIRPGTMERFAERFAPCGFSRSAFVPCYGLAEATLLVSGKPAGEPPVLYRYDADKLRGNLAVQDEQLAGNHLLAGSGSVAEGLQVEIVDPETSTPAAFGHVGEIWVAGPSVALGYWRNDQATKEAFRARTTISSASFLRTGDLGFRLGDELFVTGRLKDLIIVRGQNHYPQDLESTAATSDPVLATSIGAAFSVESDSGSPVVLAQEVPRQIVSSEELLRLERAIRKAVGEQEGITLERVALVKFGSIPRTTSGKVRRRACRDMYLAGNLEELNRADGQQPTFDIEATASTETQGATRLLAFCQLAGEMAQIKPEKIDPGHSLLALGLDSLMMTNLRFQIEERLALSVSLEHMLAGKSLGELAAEAQDTLRNLPRVEQNTTASASSTEEFPLSMGQRAIWFLHLLSPDSPAYNLFSASRSNRPFDIPVLREAFQVLTDRHSLLRSLVVNLEDGPVHRLLPDYEVDFTLMEGADWNDATLHEYLRKEANRTFNPSEKPPFRVSVIRQSERGDVLLVVLHHLLADLSSISILLEDLCTAYTALLSHGEPELPIRPHYSSFVASQADTLCSGHWNRQRDFWLEYLRDAQVALASPFDRSSRSPGGSGGTVRFRIEEELTRRIKHRAASTNVSLYTFLMAAFQTLLLRLTAQDDLLVGSVVSGRTEAAWAGTVGYCVNQIVLRARWNEDSTFLDLLSHTQRDVSEALECQDYPFGALTDDFHTIYGSRNEPLTRITFSLQTAAKRTGRGLSSFLLGHDGNTLRLGEFELDALEIDNEGAQFDLSLVISEGASELLGVLQYRSDLLEREFVETLARQFEFVLETVTADTECRLQEIPLLAENERVQILEDWNRTEVPYEGDLAIDEFIERQARIAPDACAIRAQDGELTYGELSAQSNRLAKLLRQKGVDEETVVGLHCHRTMHLPIAMLAILKSGGAFLPLDPALPAERVAYMLEQTSAPIVLSDESEAWSALSLSTPIEIVKVDDPPSWTANGDFEAEADLSQDSSTDRLAYVIFTSGSTGRPKGVMVTHRNVVNFFKGMDSHLDCRLGDRFIALTSISFDISMLELLWPLTHGAQIALVPERGRRGASLLSIDREDSKGPEFSLFYFADASEQRGHERYRLLLEGAKFADRNGFAAVWTPERHFHRFGGSYPNPSLTSAAIAAVTERVAIRAGSVVLPLHDPIRVAEEWSMIDNLSGGRAGVAFASGWHVDDFVLAPDRYANRREVMLAGIKRLQQLWRGESVEALNGNGKTIQIQLYPSPVQPELPIWITASGTPATFQLAGTLGANLLTHLLGQTLDEVAANIERYHEALRQNGFDPATRCVTLMLHTYLGEDRDTVKERIRMPFREYLRSSLGLIEKLIASLGLPVDLKNLSPKDLDDLLDFAFNRYWETSGLFGTVDGCRPMVDRIAKMGVSEVACLVDFGVDTDLVLNSLPLLRSLMQSSQTDRAPHENVSLESDRKPRTFLQCTPSMMKLLLAEGDDTLLGTIDTLLLGGEPVPGALVERIGERYGCRIFNMYGPTETTIWSTVQEMQSGEQPITVGRPIANTQCYILDRHDLPVPLGAIGELLIGGNGVARGYWGRADLTNERFIPDCISSREGSRLYRTGDIARYLHDGRIEILGRSDYQVKIRGFRVELPEIEIALAAHAEVRDVVVIKRGGGDDVRLAAFYVSTANLAIPADALREFLRRTLPEYMIPSEFVHIEKIPLMTSGKVDRKQLEALQVKLHSTAANGHHHPALPHGHLESHVFEIWKKVLHLEAVGLDDNFFDLGGHSLLMVQVYTALTEQLGHQFPLIKLLENPTIRQLAASLSIDESKPGENRLSPEADRAALQRNRLDELRRNAVAMRSVAS
jgi:natural product biosynthesis luciferase-like monooxygenase protein